MTTKPSLVPADKPCVDVGALAGDFQREVATRVAATIAYTLDGLESDECPLSEKQRIELIQAAIRHFDGMEVWFAKELKDELEREGVIVWGLPGEIETLLRPPSAPPA